MISRALVVTLFLLLTPVLRALDWVGMEKVGNVAFFYVSSPAQIMRYDTTTKTWLTPLTLPVSRGALTSGKIDADGIYIAYDKAVYRYDLQAGSETHVITVANTVQSLFTDGNLLLINHTAGLYANVATVNKTNNASLSATSVYISSIYGASIAPGLNRIFGTSRGISPADVTYLEYRNDGTFVGGGDSIHHGSYAIGTRTWVFPNEGRFVDTTGNVYNSTEMSYAMSFGTTIDDIAFSGTDVPIVLTTNKITAFTNTLLPAGSAQLSAVAKSILVVGDQVIAFRATAGADIGTEIVALSALSAPQPGLPPSPEALPYTPDIAFTDSLNLAYFYSKAQQTIFRWDVNAQDYIDGIPLLGGATLVAYSPVNERIYTAYSTGLIRKIELNSLDWSEAPFAQLATAPHGLTAVGSYLFTADRSGAWGSHYTYSADGTRISAKDWNYYSTEYIWNATNQKIYFFRDDTSPNDLLWEEINSNGTTYPALAAGAIGVYKDSPLHTSTGFTHPIRPSQDGTVVALGSGMLHNGVTLERLTTALANTFVDATWATGGLYSIRLSGAASTQFQQWQPPTYGVNAVLQVPGTPRRILTLPNGNLLAITTASDGIPSFYILDTQFNVLAPPVIAAPKSVVGTILSTTSVRLSWRDVTGETAYRIERRANADTFWTQIGTTTISETAYIDASVQLGNVYNYRVIAANGAKVSMPSAEVAIVFAVPNQPTLQGTVLTTSQTQLNWVLTDRATSYVLQRLIAPGTTWSTIASPTAATVQYTDSSLSANTTYSYRLQAVNSLGGSVYSDAVTLVTPQIPPATPVFNTPSLSGTTTVYLSWGTAARAETYRIERLTPPSTWASIATTALNSYSDTSVTFSTSYTYRIVAINAAGESIASTARTIAVPALPLPTTPINFKAQPLTSTSIALTWTDSSNESNYRIERRIGEGTWILLDTLAANVTDYVDATAVTGTYYNYRIISINQAGQATSSEINIQAAAIGVLVQENFDPITPFFWEELTGGTVFAGPVGFYSGKALWMGAAGTRRVTLRPVDTAQGGWLKFRFRAGNSARDGTTYWDNSEAGEHVTLQYSVNGIDWTAIQQLATLYPSNSDWTLYNITLPSGALSANTRFRWIQASNSGASVDTWALDNIEIIGVIPEAPGSPPFIMASANSSRSVSVSWIAAERASLYIVERRTPTTDWSAIGQTGVGQTFYVDQTAAPATIYSYRVTARNASGDSTPSNYTIVNTWSTLADWRFQNYGTLNNTGTAASLADNGTGVPNLFKFAFNMSATDRFYQVQSQGGIKGMPNIQLHSDTGLLQVAFIRRRAESNPGITYIVEYSDNLVLWTAAGQEIITAAIDEDFEYVVWEDDPVGQGTRTARFARVRVVE